MTLETIGVVGAGQMGGGIAQVAAVAGYNVILRDIKDEYVDRGLEAIQGSLTKFSEKGKLDEDVETIMDRIEGTTKLKKMADADFVVEAIIENQEAKVELFQELDEITEDHVVLASNTSSIPITALAAATNRPTQVIGMHFFNPVPLMKLVEVIRGHDTSDATTEMVLDLAGKLGKTAVGVEDYPGFVSNRVLMPMLNEAMFAYHEGVGDAEAIDTVMKLGMNHPMGPLELADYVGLDTCLAILEVLQDGFGD
ncbi:MAG: 3-hydroxyacyl-CoA dehydrogenase NAD-binding domain-containing protein, partial [Candidatus Thermoplasmatota archaeon]|nr:3-hydroxyacyl-CoA dehydrogenase NAD-binding domain-containing protein [Candidatus Thermoplasmatota archaeon]